MPLPKSLICTACKHTYPEGWCRCPYCGFDPEKEKLDKQIDRALTRKFPRYAAAMQRDRQKATRRPGRDERTAQPQQQPQSQPAQSGQQQSGDAKKRGRRRRGRRRGQGAPGDVQQPRSEAAPQQNQQRETGQHPNAPRNGAPRDQQQRREPRPPRPPQQQQNRPPRPHVPQSAPTTGDVAAGGEGEAARKKRRRFRRRRSRPDGGGAPPQGGAPQE